MPRAPGSVPARSRPVYETFIADLEVSGREKHLSTNAARRFLVRWPDPSDWAKESLHLRLHSDGHARPFVMFLMLHRHLRPGYDFLVRRKLPSIWREMSRSPLAPELERFMAGAAELGFARQNQLAIGSQVMARLLIQSGKSLFDLTQADFGDLTDACQERERAEGVGWRHFSSSIASARAVMYHMGVLAEAPANPAKALRQSFERRMADVPENLRGGFVAYLERLTATHTPQTVTGTATRLAHFGRHLARVDPELASLAELDRRRHIETYLTAVANAVSSRHGEPISASERRARVLAISVLLNDTPNGDGTRPLRGDSCSDPTSPSCRARCLAISPLTPIAAWPVASKDPRTGSWPTRCCCSAPAGCASGSCSILSSIVCTKCRARGPG
jgi:hypothetical protein